MGEQRPLKRSVRVVEGDPVKLALELLGKGHAKEGRARFVDSHGNSVRLVKSGVPGKVRVVTYAPAPGTSTGKTPVRRKTRAR